MKKVIQIDLKMVIITIIGLVIISGTVGAFASNLVSSSDIAYCPETNNMQAATVEDALDILYARVDNVPIGTIMSYMGTSAPENYLICDGTVYNITDYQKLADHIKNNFGSYNKFGGDGTTTFAVPDLRGEFLRGSGTNSHANQGSGAAVGTHQNATEENAVRPYSGSDSSKAKFVSEIKEKGTNQYVNNLSNIDSSITTGTKRYAISTSETTIQEYASNGADSYTSRPTNTSVNYLIKAN